MCFWIVWNRKLRRSVSPCSETQRVDVDLWSSLFIVIFTVVKNNIELWVIWLYCIISNIDQSLKNMRTNWKSLAFLIFTGTSWENMDLFCVLLRKKRVLSVNSVSDRLCAAVLFLLSGPVCVSDVQRPKTKGHNLYEEVYLYRLIVHLFCSGVLSECHY